MRPRSEVSSKLENPVRAVLIDQHPLWLDIVERALQGLGGEVIGKYTSPALGLGALEETKPELLVMDIETQAVENEIDGFECLRRAITGQPDLKVVVFSSANVDGVIASTLAAGAAAYVIKTVQPEDFVSAIRQVCLQSVHYAPTPALAARPERVPSEKHGLTNREVEILQLVAEGLTNTKVAQRLFVTEQTVKFHLSNTYRKLGLSNRTEASRWAQMHGLLEQDPAKASGLVADRRLLRAQATT